MTNIMPPWRVLEGSWRDIFGDLGGIRRYEASTVPLGGPGKAAASAATFWGLGRGCSGTHRWRPVSEPHCEDLGDFGVPVWYIPTSPSMEGLDFRSLMFCKLPFISGNFRMSPWRLHRKPRRAV